LLSWRAPAAGALVQGTMGLGTLATFLGWLAGEIAIFYILFAIIFPRASSGSFLDWLGGFFVLAVGAGWTVGGVAFLRSATAQLFGNRVSRLLLGADRLVYQPGRDDAPDDGEKAASVTDIRRVVPETQSGTLYLRLTVGEGGFALGGGLTIEDREWLQSVLKQWSAHRPTTVPRRAAKREKERRDSAARSSLQRILSSPIDLLEDADIEVADQGRGVLLSWRRPISKEPGRVGTGLFMLFWLCAWAVGEGLVVLCTLALIIGFILGFDPPRGMGWKALPLLLVFAALWTFVGTKVFQEMSDRIGLRKPSRLWLSRDELAYKGGSGEFGWFRRRRYLRTDLKKVALELRRGRRRLMVYTDRRPFEIGRNLRFGQREWLYKVLHQWLEG